MGVRSKNGSGVWLGVEVENGCISGLSEAVTVIGGSVGLAAQAASRKQTHARYHKK